VLTDELSRTNNPWRINAIAGILQADNQKIAKEDNLKQLVQSLVSLLPAAPNANSDDNPSSFIFPAGALPQIVPLSIPQAIPTLFFPNPGVEIVTDSATPTGSGVAVAYQDPEPVSEAAEIAQGSKLVALVENGLDPNEAIAALKQTQKTRYLRFSNATERGLKVFVVYSTLNENGKEETNDAKPLELTLDAGDVADIFDNDWRVNATKARIWAESLDGLKVWETFKSKPLPFVPEGSYESEGLEIQIVKFQ
jgi:hypothetical protein